MKKKKNLADRRENNKKKTKEIAINKIIYFMEKKNIFNVNSKNFFFTKIMLENYMKIYTKTQNGSYIRFIGFIFFSNFFLPK
jgi:hypothetical protein